MHHNHSASSLHANYSLLHYVNARAMEQTGPLTIVKGNNIYVEDESGNQYIEAMAGLWSVAVGFSEKRIAEAAYKQLQKLPYYHSFGGSSHESAALLAQTLIDMAPADMSRAHFTNSGSEANDTAIKLARYYHHACGKPDKQVIISREKAYHGSTIGSGSLTGLPFAHQGFGMPIENIGFTSCPHYWRYGHDNESEEAFSTRCAAELEATIQEQGGTDKVAAFIGEPVMGVGGVIPPPTGYWQKIAEVCNAHNMLLIADEVICGFGRTGARFGCDKYNIRPDILVLSKQLTSSYMPMAAVLINDKVYQKAADNSQKFGIFGNGITGAAHPLACAVALENLRILTEDGIMDRVAVLEPIFQSRIQQLAKFPQIGEVRGVGLIGAIEIVADRKTKEPFQPVGSQGAALRQLCINEGVIVRNLVDSIAFCPPLIITEQQIHDLFDRVQAALEQHAQSLNLQ
ncbi:MAG: aminotransferase [Gammaproteobacteria bacterium]